MNYSDVGAYNDKYIPAKCFVSPRAVDWIADGSEGRNTLVHSGVLQEADQSPVASHAEEKNYHKASVALGHVVSNNWSNKRNKCETQV